MSQDKRFLVEAAGMRKKCVSHLTSREINLLANPPKKGRPMTEEAKAKMLATRKANHEAREAERERKREAEAKYRQAVDQLEEIAGRDGSTDAILATVILGMLDKIEELESRDYDYYDD